MLFNSLQYIFLFLPSAAAGYFILNSHTRHRLAMAWLVLASLFFYGYWNPAYVPFILLSIGFNYGIATALNHLSDFRRSVLVVGVCTNIFLLGYYKYANFIVDNLNTLAHTDLHLHKIVLPLAISFFTFQQVAFLVDTYRREAPQPGLLDYSLFICFFPQLIAGPIVHHAELIPQFNDPRKNGIRWDNIALGLFLFAIGLFKKCVIADSLAVFADQGFDHSTSLSIYAAWLTTLSYTFQLYFDFSGYTDMALGSARIMNITLPANFNAPYRALSIRDFWRRWHITLSRFLRKYLYIPLGGNRSGEAKTYVNLFLTFLIGGIWHGAGWTFLAWGALHGAGIVVHRAWEKSGFRLPRWLSWVTTFTFVSFCWVFFRANSFQDAFKVIGGMLDFHGLSLHGLHAFLAEQSGFLADYGVHLPIRTISLGVNTATLVSIAFCFGVVKWGQNSGEIMTKYRPQVSTALYSSILLFFGLLTFFSDIPSKFIYFQF